MARPQPPRTPLRRLSQGSLRALSRSGSFPDAPAGLGFLEPAMAELADETEALHANVIGLQELSRSLQNFNESFASYLYVMDMNSLTTDWPQAPTDISFEFARKRAEDEAKNAQAALLAARIAAADAEKLAAASDISALDANETTYSGNSAVNTVTGQGKGASSKIPMGILKSGGSGLPKKKVKPKMTPKEKRERSLAIEKTISSLPIEFRGQHIDLRKNAEAVIEMLMDNPNGLEILGFVKPPDLTQVRANKCLIALVNRKIVTKDNSSGRVLYVWNGVPT